MSTMSQPSKIHDSSIILLFSSISSTDEIQFLKFLLSSFETSCRWIESENFSTCTPGRIRVG